MPAVTLHSNYGLTACLSLALRACARLGFSATERAAATACHFAAISCPVAGYMRVARSISCYACAALHTLCPAATAAARHAARSSPRHAPSAHTRGAFLLGVRRFVYRGPDALRRLPGAGGTALPAAHAAAAVAAPGVSLTAQGALERPRCFHYNACCCSDYPHAAMALGHFTPVPPSPYRLPQHFLTMTRRCRLRTTVP